MKTRPRKCSQCGNDSLYQWDFVGHDEMSCETYTDSCMECLTTAIGSAWVTVFDPRNYQGR